MNAPGPSGAEALGALRRLRDGLFTQVCRPIQFPEPSLVLDLESRKDSAERTFKHLHQSSLLQRENFCASAQIKHLYLIDAYLALATSQNALGLYAIARSMFEFNAFLHEVSDRLVIAANRAAADWRAAGQEFFGLLVRARYATTDPGHHETLRSEGVSADRLKPFNVTNCIRRLSARPDHQDAEARYARLCDFVHHNLGSATLANAGSAAADVALATGGGSMLMPGGGTIIQYEYPLPMKYEVALEDTAPGFLRDAGACVEWVNAVPASPYTPEVIEQFTGSRLGVPMLRPPAAQPIPHRPEE